MKIKIKSFNGVLADFLTLDKSYLVQEVLDDYLLSVNDDNGDTMIVYTEDCVFLNGGSWEVVDE